MVNRWGIHAPNNARPRRMVEFFEAGFQNYTVLSGNENLIPQIRSRYPGAQILVRMYLTQWDEKDPAEWAREVVDFMNRNRPFTNQVTWANEQNLDLEGHPLGASPGNFFPPIALYQDINRWNSEMIRRLREELPWARLHYPALANGHSDDMNQVGYTGLEVCRPGILAADVLDCHCYWNVDEGPLTLEGGQRFVLSHTFFPDKPIFISECGNFAVRDPRSPEQYVRWMHSLYHYPYVEGATFFIWDSDGAAENAPNVITESGALVRALRDTLKDDPAELPPIPSAPPRIVVTRPPTPVQPIPASGDYIVLPGDTLIAIAKRFGVELVQLMNLNSISDARLLRAGQRLRIPGGGDAPQSPGETTAPPQPAPSGGDGGAGAGQPPESAPTLLPPTPPQSSQPVQSGAIYVVRSGDTVSAIARRFNVTVEAIASTNNLADPDRIRAGQPLIIPKPAVVLSVAEAMAMTEASKPRGGVLGVGDASTPVVTPREIQEFLKGKRTTFYVTRKGDTISRVAGLFKMEPLVLSQINQIGMQGEMIPGTRLIIPMK